jgi:hypothetical protein
VGKEQGRGVQYVAGLKAKAMAGQTIDIGKPAAAPELEKTYPASLGYMIQLNSQRQKKLIQVQRR